MKNKTVKNIFLIISLVIVAGFSCSRVRIVDKDNTADKTQLKQHVLNIINTPEPRNYKNIESLNQVANYIENSFRTYCQNVSTQEFIVENNTYKNIICSFGPQDKERIIVGAHYDVCGNQPGADDNASAVAGLLELVRLLKLNSNDLKYRIDLVAYTLEEPPFFGTQSMGSAHHANYLKESNIKVKVMICLEMIGYFTDKPNSQRLPLKILKLFYPTTGNFIAVVSNFKSSGIGRKIKKIMKKNSDIKVCKLTAPSSVRGVDFSDHRNYWANGFKSVMITDTAFFRNRNYHKKTDTIDTLDFDKMAEVVKGVYAAIISL